MSETILQEIYNEIKKIRGKLEQLEELNSASRKISEDELQEIRKLKEESLKGSIWEGGLMFRVVVYKKVSKELRTHLRKFAELVEIIKTDPIP